LNPAKSVTAPIPRLIALLIAALVLPAGPQAIAEPPAKVEVLILFRDKPGPKQTEMVKRHGGSVKKSFRIVHAVSATVPEAAAERIRKEAGVTAVEADGVVKGHDILNTWGVGRIGCGLVHDGTFGADTAPVLGKGVRVAIVDSGIDYNHPELVLNYAGGHDLVNNDTDPADDHGHGTHVAGTVGALLDGFGVVGAAPEADLYAVKVLNSSLSGTWSGVIASLDWCIDNSIDVANFSLGGPAHPGLAVETAFNNAEAAGLVIVASAGNDGQGADTVGYPAKFGSVIAVGSTTSADQRSSFSSTGPDLELAAPGSNIYSTNPGSGYGTRSGTSMAAPHVTGAAALVIAAGIADGDSDGKINDEVRAVLQMSAEDLGNVGFDNEFGHGLIDAELGVILALTYGGGGGGVGGDPDPIFNPPTNLSGSVSGSDVTLLWDDNADVEDGFQIQIGAKSKSTTTWSDLGFVGADTTLFSTAVSDGKHLFRVRAYRDDTGANTGWSSEIQLSVGGTKGGGGVGGKGGRQK
jgi:subtilisin